MKKGKTYRKTGMLDWKQFSREITANWLRECRRVGKVIKKTHKDGFKSYQSTDKHNPYLIGVFPHER